MANLELTKTIKTMLKYGLPLSIGAILSGFLTQFYSFIMAIFVTDNALIGNYSVALNFVVLNYFFCHSSDNHVVSCILQVGC